MTSCATARMHKMDVSRRRVGMMLVLLLLGDFTLVQASPAHRVHLVATKAKDDTPSSTLKPMSLPQRFSSDADKTHPSGESVSMPGSVANDPANLQLSQVEEDDLIRHVDRRLQKQKDHVNSEMFVKAFGIMADLAAFDDLLSIKDDWLGSVRGLCGEGVLTFIEQVWSNMDDETVLHVLTGVALLQRNSCPRAAVLLASRLVDQLDTVSTTQRSSVRTTGKDNPRGDPCEGSAECREKDVITVRQILGHFPALVTLYDTAATAIFAASENQDTTEALLDYVLEDLNISTDSAHMNRLSMHLPRTHGPLKRSSCEDRDERKAQSVISWIPFIGTVYNMVSAAVYAGKGCTEVARQRAIDGSMDLVMDAATIVTGGAAAGIATGVKTMVKVGVKAGLKAGLKAGAKSGAKAFAKLGKTMLKETVKGYKNPLKGAIREVKDTVGTVVKGIKAVPKVIKAVPKVAKKGKQLAKQSFHTIKETAQQIGKKGTKTVDDLPVKKSIPDSPSRSSSYSKNTDQAGRNVDDAVEESRHILCKRSPPSKKRFCSGYQQNFKKRADPQVQGSYNQRFEDIWQRLNPKPVSPPMGISIPKAPSPAPFYQLDLTTGAYSNKELFQALQQHRVFSKSQDAGLLVEMDLAGKRMIFASVPSEWSGGLVSKSVGQVGVYSRKGNRFIAESYTDIAKRMDEFANIKPQSRPEIYKAMRDAIDSTANRANQGKKFADAFDNTPVGKAAEDAAADLVVITHTAEAVPRLPNVPGKSGRTPGTDASFRKALEDEIQAGGQRSFEDFFKAFPFIAQGGTNLQRRTIWTSINPDTLAKKGLDVDRMYKAGNLSPV
ncbi:uncharacterized protein LOC143277470 [Babylonia areolata]|uniref:uncharacterized protein LOC143277470 n=1 Tax=Babylonia areolata TaxID=304850 RepID=UPI003FD0B41E